MCTVTFIPKDNGDFSLVSNRDEAPGRETLPPHTYEIEGVSCLFPKDELAGGSWIGVSGRNRGVCLLNGGFNSHGRSNFGRSRGLIVLDLLVAENTRVFLNQLQLENIEPFTIIAIDWNSGLELVECVWDGQHKYIKQMPIAPRVWSSRQLYTTEVAHKREQWFAEFLKQQTVDIKQQLNFHKSGGIGDPENDLVMNRRFVRTKSISCFSKNEAKVFFRYENLANELVTHHYL